MGDAIRNILRGLASLRLTVVLLALAMALVFAGTLAQTNQGIWSVQKEYFHTPMIWAQFLPLPVDFSLNYDWFRLPLPFPLPGGYVIGGLMLLNLLAAHTMRFKFNWKRSGILLIHAGLILLLVGELVTSLFAVEMQMRITEGQSVNYAQDVREAELAVIDPSDPGHDKVVAIPASRLVPGAVIRAPALPFEVRVERYYANSTILGPAQAGPNAVHIADAGMGAKLVVNELPDETDSEHVNIPSAFVTLGTPTEKLGTYLASVHLGEERVTAGGKTYLVGLRFRRYYKPYSIHLAKFTHEKYAGTETPKNFASRIRLVDARHNEDRDVLIYMNNPLRYEGETFYQAGFEKGDRTTILQVVRNPGAWLPYISCTMVGLGMLVHFGMHLTKFLRGRFT